MSMLYLIQLFGLLALLIISSTAASTEHRYLRTSRNDEKQQHDRRTELIETRIVGGQEAPLNSYPFYIQWEQGCGGVLFHDDLVLTAAHCNSIPNAINRYGVYVGGDGTDLSGTRVLATAAFQHPLYNPSNVHLYDFIVLKLPQLFPSIPLARLNTDANLPVNGQPLTVVGHGLLTESGKREDTPTIYHQVTIPYIPDCSIYYNKLNYAVQFCAGEMPNGGKDACQGDSGSGIFDANGVLVGLVSWGIGCARPNRPGVYARVSAVDRWLEHLKCQVSDNPPESCTTLIVSITVDDYPEEIGFSLLDKSHPTQQTMRTVPPGTMAVAPGGTVEYTLSVPKERDYILQVQDTKMDGFCCEFGSGKVVVRDQFRGLEYQLSGEFRSEFASIEIPNVGGSLPPSIMEQQQYSNSGPLTTPLPPQPMYAIQIILMYTSFDEQVTWKIFRQEPDGSLTTIHEDIPRNPDRFLDEHQRQIKQFYNLDAGYYQFQVEDPNGATNPGLSNGRVFLLDNGTSDLLERLYEVDGRTSLAAGAATGRFTLGL